MEEWDDAIDEVIETLEVPFDSHLVIKKLAHRNQQRYVKALAALVDSNSDTPFHQLHSALGRRIKIVCELRRLVGTDSRSHDMFGQNSKCQKWSRVANR
ncbi:MAG: hypothetical protein BA863_03015 [Desulfovibrio sp. S3730MH75]|jgi:hypothetical protein|nr:MAG: hypothetical protein BA863_03015 [Desulfovibrio sp. S3730MH75]